MTKFQYPRTIEEKVIEYNSNYKVKVQIVERQFAKHYTLEEHYWHNDVGQWRGPKYSSHTKPPTKLYNQLIEHYQNVRDQGLRWYVKNMREQ